MTVRIVPLTSQEAGEVRIGGSAAEMVAIVARLSELLWARTHQPLPTYTRATIPVAIVALGARPDRD